MCHKSLKWQKKPSKKEALHKASNNPLYNFARTVAGECYTFCEYMSGRLYYGQPIHLCRSWHIHLLNFSESNFLFFVGCHYWTTDTRVITLSNSNEKLNQNKKQVIAAKKATDWFLFDIYWKAWILANTSSVGFSLPSYIYQKKKVSNNASTYAEMKAWAW